MRPRRWMPAVVLSALLAGGNVLHGQTAARNLEYEVKAGFLRHFFSFIDWPAASFADPGAPFRLCILGRDPFGAQLDEVMRGESVNGHPIRVERVRDEVPAGCHALYTAGDAEAQAPALQRVHRRQGLLVVGDTRRLFEHCGAIAFVVESERVRFDVNLPALTSRGLVASARLLRVAREVTNRAALCE
jgi:YfiR/HmsC-like